MIESDLRAPTIEDLDNPAADFVGWVSGLLDAYRPDFLVCIARGALRAVQLFVPPSAVPDTTAVIGSDALPFVPGEELQDASVVLFDDSVIYGSTMRDVYDYLELRGARVTCAAYVVDREIFFGDSEDGTPRKPSPHNAHLPLVYRFKRWSSAIRSHHAQLVQRVLESRLDYNADFPAVSLDLKPFPIGELPYLQRRLRSCQNVRRIENVSHPMAAYGNTVRYTVLMTQDVGPLFMPGAPVVDRYFTKCRLSVTPDTGEVRLAAVVHLSMSGLPTTLPLFSSDLLNETWTSFRLPDPTDPVRLHEGTHRLISALCGLAVTSQLVPAFASALDDFGPLAVAFNHRDMEPILGAHNAHCLLQCWNRLREKGLSPLRTGVEYRQAQDVSTQSKLPARVAALLRENSVLRPSKDDTPWESVGRVFLALREATDSAEMRLVNGSAARLRTGLTFEDILAILNGSLDLHVSEDDVSAVLDMYVDSGLTVPKIIEREGSWLRAFYSGENEEQQPILQLKRHLHDAYASYVGRLGKAERDAKLLTRFDAAKLCVALKHLMPRLPITLAPRQFGYVGVPAHTSSHTPGWLYEGRYAPFASTDTARGPRLVPNPTFSTPVSPAWPNDETRKFNDAFAYLTKAFRKLGDDPKLLLTTCLTHRHAFNSVAFEAHAWADTDPTGFGSVAHCAKQGADGDDTARTDLPLHVYWCFTLLSEARRKERVFYHGYAESKRRLEHAVTDGGKDDAALRWWHWLERTSILDPEARPEIEAKWSKLRPIITQMELLTGYTTGLLLSADLLSLGELAAEFAKHGTRIADPKFKSIPFRRWVEAGKHYNANIDESAFVGASSCSLRLSDQDDVAVLPAVLDFAHRSFLELRGALLAVCPPYESADPAFPFAPDVSRRARADGSEERRLDNVFVLAADVVGSTGASVTLEMRDRVRGVFDRLRSKGLYPQATGDDKFLACARDPRLILEACQLLKLEGESLGPFVDGAFAGTRKGIMFGSVIAIQAGEWCVLEDASPASVLAQVTSLASGIDPHIPYTERNGFVVIDERAYQKGGRSMDAALLDHRRVQVESKHYFGFALLARVR